MYVLSEKLSINGARFQLIKWCVQHTLTQLTFKRKRPHFLIVKTLCTQNPIHC